MIRRLPRDAYVVRVLYINEYPDSVPSLKMEFLNAEVDCVYVGSGGKTAPLRAIKPLQKALKNFQPDVVHTHLPDATFSGVIAARLSSVRSIVIHEHNTHQLYSWKLRLALSFVRHLASLTVCFTPVVEEELFGSSQVLTEPPARLSRRSYSIRNGADTSRISAALSERSRMRAELGIGREDVAIVNLARMIDWKGQRQLLEAYQRLSANDPNLYLIFIGTGPLRQELEDIAAQGPHPDHVLFLGARSDVPQILSAGDIACLALVYAPGMTGESIGMAGTEMMAAGMPLIASDYPAARALIAHGSNGMLVTPGNVDELTEALGLLVSDTDLRRKIGEAGKELVERDLSWTNLVFIYEKIYTLLTRP